MGGGALTAGTVPTGWYGVNGLNRITSGTSAEHPRARSDLRVRVPRRATGAPADAPAARGAAGVSRGVA
jgi:hypothetical protein